MVNNKMKKTYISPNSLIVVLGTRNHLMDVSLQNNGADLSSVSFDTTSDNAGGSQLTKENKSIWDDEW